MPTSHQIPQPAFATMACWTALSGLSRSASYEALAAGHLRGVKRGRTLLVDVQTGLDWIRSLPAATFRTPRG